MFPKVILGLLIVICGNAIVGGNANAESTGGVVISPPFQQVVVGNEPRTSFGVTLTNRTSSNQSISATTVDFKSLDESGGVAFLGSEIKDLESKYGLAKWLVIDPKPIIIQPNTSKKIVVNLENRSDLAPGGHYGAVIFKIEGGKAAEEPNSVDVKQVLASLIFAKKLGGERYDLKLSSIESPEKWTGGDQKVMLRFYNPGNVHVTPRGILKLLDAKGNVISKNTINQESGIILPEAFRVYPVVLSDVPVLKPGKYKIVAEYRYDGIEQVATLAKEITIKDWRYLAFIGAVGGVSLLPLLLGYHLWVRHRRKKRKIQPKHHAAF